MYTLNILQFGQLYLNKAGGKINFKNKETTNMFSTYCVSGSLLSILCVLTYLILTIIPRRGGAFIMLIVQMGS